MQTYKNNCVSWSQRPRGLWTFGNWDLVQCMDVCCPLWAEAMRLVDHQSYDSAKFLKGFMISEVILTGTSHEALSQRDDDEDEFCILLRTYPCDLSIIISPLDFSLLVSVMLVVYGHFGEHKQHLPSLERAAYYAHPNLFNLVTPISFV